MNDPHDKPLARVLELLATASDAVRGALRDAEGPAVDDELLAAEYARTAALYRRRAARRPEDAQRLARRAEWFEQRARVKRAGDPMPRDLRTPTETMAVVDQFRCAIATSLVLASEFGVGELRAFARCLAAPHAQPADDAALQAFINAATRMLGHLGGLRRPDGLCEIDEYTVPLTDEASPET
jgi:hypothetical protein